MKLRKKIIRWAFVITGTALALIIIAGAILYSQQHRLTQMAVKELNKQFAGELLIESSHISPFSHFPYISIALNKVRFFADKKQRTHPLYEVERLYAGFSLPDILRQQYNVRIIALKNGHLHIEKYANGEVNLLKAHAFKTDTTSAATTSTGALSMDLRKVILKNMEVTYQDRSSGWQVTTHIEKIKAGFKMDSGHIAVTLDSKMLIDIKSRTDTTLFKNKRLALDIKLDYDKVKQQLTIPPSTLLLENASLRTEGMVLLSNGCYLDLKVKGDRPDLNLLMALVPDNIADLLEKYKQDGRIYFDGSVKGPLGKGTMPLVKVNFGCEDVWFQNKQVDRKVDQLGFKGYYTNGEGRSLETSELQLLNLNARPGKGVFRGNFVMRNFTDPRIVMQLYSELDLRFLGEFLGIKDLEQISGQIALNMNFKELVDMQFPEQSLAQLKEGVESELTVKQLEFRIPGYHHAVRNMNLHAEVKQGHLVLDSLAFRIGSSDFFMHASLSDLPAIFHQQEKPVSVTFNARSSRVNLGELIRFDSAYAALGKEIISGFNIGLAFETSVKELLHPDPLPRGTFRIRQLSARMQEYPHTLHNFGADIAINDTSLLIRDFTGNIDSSGFMFKGRLNNYPLWFSKVKKGRTQFAFDLKSNRLSMEDLLGSQGKMYVPQGYWKETATGLWLRAKMDMRYDTVFKMADLRIANASGQLNVHPIKLESIKGRIRYGKDRFLAVDTLTGKIGRSDFDINLRLFAKGGKKKRENSFRFNSTFLDIDELMNYDFSSSEDQPLVNTAAAPARIKANDSLHAAGFNVFRIPFSNFDAQVNVKKVKYRRLWLKNVIAGIHMKEEQKLKIDTIGLEIAKGHIGMRGFFNAADPQKLYFRSRIKVDHVDLNKLLIKFDNFGQDMVLNNNLKGTLSGQIKSYVRMHPDLTPVLNDTEAAMDIEIHDGSLIDFGPMQAMAGYFKDKNLRLVRFDTLRNKLQLKKGVLEIPRMNINSSLGYIEVSGTQSLNMHMDYHLRVPMKMVTQVGFQALFGKKQEEVDPDKVDAIEYRDKDKRVRFMNLRISGTTDKYKIGLGKGKTS